MSDDGLNQAGWWRSQVRSFLEEHQRIGGWVQGLTEALNQGQASLAFDHFTALQTRLYAHCAKENRFFQDFIAGTQLEGLVGSHFDETRRLAHEWAALQGRWMDRAEVENDFISFQSDVRQLLERLQHRITTEEPIYLRILEEGE